MPSLAKWLAPLLLSACGGIAVAQDGGVDSGSTSLDAAIDDAGLFACSSSQGHRVCDGTNNCPEDALCGACIKWGAVAGIDPNDKSVGLCSAGTGFSHDCDVAPDGSVCFSYQNRDEFGLTAPFPTALLFLKNGGEPKRIRYADGSLFTSEPLPLPLVCPKLPVARLCGGNCGPCADGEICHGRSPKHPYSYCIPIPPLPSSHGCSKTYPKCDAGFGCFILEDGAPPPPENWGYCLELSICQDLAKNLPGGGTCIAP